MLSSPPPDIVLSTESGRDTTEVATDPSRGGSRIGITETVTTPVARMVPGGFCTLHTMLSPPAASSARGLTLAPTSTAPFTLYESEEGGEGERKRERSAFPPVFCWRRERETGTSNVSAGGSQVKVGDTFEGTAGTSARDVCACACVNQWAAQQNKREGLEWKPHRRDT